MQSNMNDELWRVQLSTGEIRTMTLEALDRAFDDGLIDARVPVLAPGSSTWTTLGAAAGLDDGSTELTPSLSPVAISSSDSEATPHVPAGAESDFGPELPDDLDFEPRRRRGLVIGGAVVAVVALAAAFTVVVGKVGGSSEVKATTAVQAPPAAEPLPPPAVAEPAKDAKASLSDWQKKMLLDADKSREEKTRSKTQEKAEKVQKRKPTPKTSPGLLNGGDKFDPLNGQL